MTCNKAIFTFLPFTFMYIVVGYCFNWVLAWNVKPTATSCSLKICFLDNGPGTWVNGKKAYGCCASLMVKSMCIIMVYVQTKKNYSNLTHEFWKFSFCFCCALHISERISQQGPGRVSCYTTREHDLRLVQVLELSNTMTAGSILFCSSLNDVLSKLK
jgi:hypothetical protein